MRLTNILSPKVSASAVSFFNSISESAPRAPAWNLRPETASDTADRPVDLAFTQLRAQDGTFQSVEVGFPLQAEGGAIARCDEMLPKNARSGFLALGVHDLHHLHIWARAQCPAGEAGGYGAQDQLAVGVEQAWQPGKVSYLMESQGS